MVAAVALIINCALLVYGSDVQPANSPRHAAANPDTVLSDAPAGKLTLALDVFDFEKILKGYRPRVLLGTVLDDFDSIVDAYKAWLNDIMMDVAKAMRESVSALTAPGADEGNNERIESIRKKFLERCWEHATDEKVKEFDRVSAVACASILRSIDEWVNDLYIRCGQEARIRHYSQQALADDHTSANNACDGSWAVMLKENTTDYLRTLFRSFEDFFESHELVSSSGKELGAAGASVVKERLENWIAIHNTFTTVLQIVHTNMRGLEASKAEIERACVALIGPGQWQAVDNHFINKDTRMSPEETVFDLFELSKLDLTHRLSETRAFIEFYRDYGARLK
ncbi:hypothetical protein PAPHI01_1382 [Pancytospora philotis]|nr:hypothetical protein PAPHI01_1382 [Pancytospora philotis]